MRGFCVLLAIVVAGCSGSKSETTFTSDDNKSTVVVDGDSGALKVKGEGVEGEFGGDTSVSEQEMGVKFYPGSSERKGESMKIKTKRGQTLVSVRETSDSIEQVAQFYQGIIKGFHEFPGKEKDRKYLTGKSGDGADLAIDVARKGNSTKIQLSKAP